MILHLSLDEQLAERAQQVAESKGMSLDQLIRHYLEDLTTQSTLEEDIDELRRLSGQGNSQGWKFNRDEIHSRETSELPAPPPAELEAPEST